MTAYSPQPPLSLVAPAAYGCSPIVLSATTRYGESLDIDLGGVRIFRFLEETLPRPPMPHQMDYELAQSKGHPGSADGSLSAIAISSSAVSALAERLSRANDIRHLEQEALDPVSPRVANEMAKAPAHA